MTDNDKMKEFDLIGNDEDIKDLANLSVGNYDPSSEFAQTLGPPFFYDKNTEKLCGAWLYFWALHRHDDTLEFPTTWGNKNNPFPLLPTLASYGNIVKNAKNDGGSMNHYILRNALRLCYSYLTNDRASLQLAIDRIHYWFVSQLHQGHGWFANRDETTSPGYTKLHVAGVGAIKLINSFYNIDDDIEKYADEWLIHQAALFKLCMFKSHVYFPGKRSKPYGKMLGGNLFEARYNREFDNLYDLLTMGTSREEEHFYQVTNKIGHPANIGSYFIRECVLEPGVFTPIGNALDYVTDLPKLGSTLTVQKSNDIFVAYYNHVDVTQDKDWMHWKVQKLSNEKLATEIAEYGYTHEPRVPLNIPNIPSDKVITSVVIGKSGPTVYVDKED